MKATSSYLIAYHRSDPYRCRLLVEELRRDHANHYRVCLYLPQGKICEDTNGTLFAALINIRKIIEPDGWRLGINASRLDAINGTTFNDVFVYVPESKGIWKQVLALEEAPLSEIATVEQQLEFSNGLERYDIAPHSEMKHNRRKWWNYISNAGS